MSMARRCIRLSRDENTKSTSVASEASLQITEEDTYILSGIDTGGG